LKIEIVIGIPLLSEFVFIIGLFFLISSNGRMDAVLPCVGFERWLLGSIADHAVFDDLFLMRAF